MPSAEVEHHGTSTDLTRFLVHRRERLAPAVEPLVRPTIFSGW